MKKKIVSLVLVFAMALALGIGGTVAWLTAKTNSVVNTFTAGDINIKLDETTGTDYKFVPGATISKNPKVTVNANSEACWLFVKVEKSANFDNFMKYDIADGWTELTDVSGVYYRTVAATNADTEFPVLKDNQVSVLTTVTKDMINAEGFSKPTLTFTAYAIQSDYLKAEGSTTVITAAADAWALVPKQ